MADPEISDYERLRQSNISRNTAILDSLELKGATFSFESSTPFCKKVKTVPSTEHERL